MTRGTELPKTATGIDGLDAITLGGLPTGRPTLLCGTAGAGKTLFAMTFLVEGATRFAEPGVFMSFEEREADLAANVASLGYDVRRLVAESYLPSITFASSAPRLKKAASMTWRGCLSD